MAISTPKVPGRALPWLCLAAGLAGVTAACLGALAPPALATRDATPDRFSEPRARDLVRMLSETVGYRVNGTEAHAHAAELLVAALRQIPRLEVELQTPSGVQVFRSVKLPAFVYRTINVVARLPGRSPEAILLNAHFDTLVDSVGAADDGAGVAALVETVRVLAREPPLARTLIINLNGAEESGLLGASGFLQHRWAKDVRAYLYLEAFPGGKAALLGAGPGAPWLVDAYARVAPTPLASVVGQELAESGLLPHHGDFTPFHEAGLSGLDVAMTGDGWAYHTALDRPERLEPAGLQHLGDTALAVTRALASAPELPPARPRDGRDMVYYDLLGTTMAVYGRSTSRALALVALALAALVLVLQGRRGLLTFGAAARGFSWTLAAVGGGLLAAVASGALLAIVGHPHGWFSAPWLVVPTFVAPALAATLALHGWWRRRTLRTSDGARHAAMTAAGGLLFWSLLLGASALAGVAAGYLALHWVAGGAIGLLASMRFPRARLACLLAGLLPGSVVTIELALLLLKYFVPATGMIAAPVPLDFLIAALVGLTVVTVAALSLTTVATAGGHGRVALACAAIWLVGFAVTATHFPYSAARPKRLVLAHAGPVQGGSDAGALLLMSADAVALPAALTAAGGFAATGPGWPTYEAWLPPFTHQRPAAPPALAPPTLEVISQGYEPNTDRRTLRLRVTGPGSQLRLLIPRQRLLAWSLSPSLDDSLAIAGQQLAHLEGLGPDGAEVTLTIKGSAPVPLELRAMGRAAATDPEVAAVKSRLPDWTTTTAVSLGVSRQSL